MGWKEKSKLDKKKSSFGRGKSGGKASVSLVWKKICWVRRIK